MINQILEKLFNSLPSTLSILIVLVLALLALFLALLFSLLLIRLILKIQWKSQTLKRFVLVKNEGNVEKPFFVKFVLSESDLKYQCLLDGIELPKAPPVQVRIKNQKNVSPSLISQEINNKSIDNASVSKAQSDPKGKKNKKLAESADAAKKQAKKGMGFMRLISGILGTLGSLIPGSVGKSFKGKATEMQKNLQDANAKMQMPEQKLKSAEHLKGQVGQLSPDSKNKKGEPTPATSSIPQQSMETNSSMQISSRVVESEVTEEFEMIESGYLITPPLCPGERYLLELKIDPANIYRTEEYPIEVFVKQDKENKMFDELVENKSIGRIFMQGLSPVYWMLTFLMVLCSVLINGTWAIMFINWMAKFIS